VVALYEQLECALVAGAQTTEEIGLLGRGHSGPMVVLDLAHGC
jgi:hypothetical protein